LTFFPEYANNKPMGIDKKMAARFAKIRQEKGITQAEFAETLKIGRSTVTNLENGTTPIIDRNIKMVCLAYNVNEVWLRTGVGEMFVDTPDGLDTDDERRLVSMFRRLLPELKIIVLDKVRELLKIAEESWVPPGENGEKKASGD